MFDKININVMWEDTLIWLKTSLWSTNTLYQCVIIIASFALGAVIYSFLKPKIVGMLDGLKMPSTVKRISGNLVKQVFTLTTLAIMFVASQVAAMEPISLNIGLLTGVMKVLFAWFAIRAAVQFIANPPVRNFFALVIWGIAALSIFGVLDQTMTALDSIAFTFGEFRLSALAVIKGTLLLIALLYMAIFISSFVERRIFKVKSLTRTSQVLMAKVIRVALIVTALLIGVTSAGIDLSLFAVFGGAIGLGIGFGLQKGISNLFSGMLLLLDRSIKPGDVIEIPDIGTFGWVNNMAARYTEIVTRDNKSFLIPNEDFITQRVINWSHGNSLVRIHLEFGVHYDANPHRVMEIAIEAAKTPARVVDTPEPVCWIIEFGDSSVNFDLRFWIKDAADGVANVRGEVYLALWDAFKEHGIAIPYPHREVFVHEVKS